MNNPVMLVQMMRNPQMMIQQLMQSSNPIARNALEMYQRGDSKGIEELARNMCSEKGTTFEEMKQKLGF